jgi:hypothetical protein
MPRVLDNFPALKGQTRYPWDEWLDGRVWALTVGEDFNAKVNTLKANAQLQAKKRGGRIRTRLLEDGDKQTLVIEFRPSRV